MSNKQALVPQETTILAEQPSSILEVIARAVSDPKIDVEKMERLLAMHERISAQQREITFKDALSRLQATVPQISKKGQIIVKGNLRSRYSKLEDIDTVVRPMMAEEGFAFTFDTKSDNGKLHTILCTMSHRDGHSETKSIVLPMDANDYRSDVQSIGSTVSYARRQLVKMHLNLIEADEDNDGSGGGEPISEQQTKDLGALLDEVKADKGKFLTLAGVNSLEEILCKDYGQAVRLLELKRKHQK